MWVTFTLLFLATEGLAASVTRFTNIECKMLVPAYATYQQCDLKILGRGVVGLNVHAKLNQGPFNNAKVNLSFWRKYSGYRPYIFNTTFDFCKFMEKTSRKLSFEKIFLDALIENSNINHTCPYKDALIVNNLVFKSEFVRFLPLPTGQYKIQLMAATNKEWKTVVSL
ncbi:uncharacterized protein Dvir_GJ12014 [Drosophila virilis]|uniref:MD-2-related lipid-recognition domain-containing protein n=1 Tax=Drosophila virilis TaxID=7244 RepID=B4LI61_DROVI|nr:uncharacterized protein Dvir_GJ12014 [Drosophila virilis]